MTDEILRTRRMLLKPQTLAEMRVRQATDPDPEMRQAYAEMIAAMEAQPDRDEWATEWRMLLADGTPIGGLDYKGMPDADGVVELGYGVDEPYRHQGYATEAVAAMVAWALRQPDCRVVTAQTLSDNAISQRVLLRNGFVRQGTGPEGPLFVYQGERR